VRACEKATTAVSRGSPGSTILDSLEALGAPVLRLACVPLGSRHWIGDFSCRSSSCLFLCPAPSSSMSLFSLVASSAPVHRPSRRDRGERRSRSHRGRLHRFCLGRYSFAGMSIVIRCYQKSTACVRRVASWVLLHPFAPSLDCSPPPRCLGMGWFSRKIHRSHVWTRS